MDFFYGVIPALIVLAAAWIVWRVARRLATLRRLRLPKWRYAAEWLILPVFALAAAGAALSSAYNAIALHLFRARNPLPGQIYVVNGHRMHINCMGAGTPEVVLDAGLGNDSTIWAAVQPELAKTTRVCAYDRAGFGLSERLSTSQDASHIVDELHGLLDAVGITRPIVLMGHSIAGLYVREYATRYPQDVAGLVIVDGSTPLQEENAALRAVDDHGWKLWVDKLESRVPAELGILRLQGLCVRNNRGFDAKAAALAGEDRCGVDWRAIDNEEGNFDLSAMETRFAGPFGKLPILIVSQDPAAAGGNQLDMAAAAAWNQMQEDLKKLSARSTRIIAKGSGHMVQLRRPELLNREVSLFIEQIRGTATRPVAYGTTVTE